VIFAGLRVLFIARRRKALAATGSRLWDSEDLPVLLDGLDEIH
jgi:hypothetical protein